VSESNRSEGLRQLAERARRDPQFLVQLINDPVAATRDIRLSDQERELIGAADAGRLLSVATALELAAGCGSSSSTCGNTCTATCTVTFTSFTGEVEQPRRG